MPNTANRGYYYPTTTTNATIPAHLALALNAVDADVQRLYDEQVLGEGIRAIRVVTKDLYESITPDPGTLYLVTAPTGIGGPDPGDGTGELSGTMGAPDFGTPIIRGSSGSSAVTIPRPPDMSSGDFLIVALRSQDATSSSFWTPSAEFVQITPTPVTLPHVSARAAAIFVRRIANLSWEPEDYTFTGPTGRNVAIGVAVNVGIGGPVQAVTSTVYGGSLGGTGERVIEAETATGAPSISLFALGAEVTAGVTHVPTLTPTGFTEIAAAQSSLNNSTAGSRTTLWLGWRAEFTTSIASATGGYPGGTSAIGAYMGSFRVGG